MGLLTERPGRSGKEIRAPDSELTHSLHIFGQQVLAGSPQGQSNGRLH